MLELTCFPIEGGDSGAWVIDNDSGRVCGHVLAYSSKSGVAYIAPMETLLDDMANTLHADITLPEFKGPPDRLSMRDSLSMTESPACSQLKHRDETISFSQNTAPSGDPDNEDLYPMSDSFASPPLPTSPPLNLRGFDQLNLKGIVAVSYSSNENFQQEREYQGKEKLRQCTKGVKAR